MESRVETDHVDLVCIRRRHGNDPTVPFRLARLLRQRRVDILHTNMWAALLEGVVAAKLARVPTVIHEEHGTIHDRRRRVIAQRVGWAMASQVVAVSDALADRMTEIVGYPRSKIQVIPNSVDVEKNRRLEFPKRQLRAEFGMPEDGYLIGMLARFVPFKNHAGVLHAVATLRETGIDAHLALAGNGPLRDELQGLARDLGIAANVHFLGETDQVARLLNSLDVFVSNSACNEGLSLALLEAMACEVPVVATAVAGHPEVLDGGKAGMLIPPKDPDALVAALRHLGDKPDVRDSLGRLGRQRAEDRYSVDVMVESYRKLYINAAGLAKMSPQSRGEDARI